MIDGYLSNTRVFDKVNDDKHQAPKPLEEAAEVFGARQESDSMRNGPSPSAWRGMRDDLIDECMDAVQATVDLLAAIGATQGEVDAALDLIDECMDAAQATANRLAAIGATQGEADAIERME